MDLHSLSQWLGHSQVSTTTRYLHLARPDVPDGARSQPLALLKRGEEVMVMPIDQATARRLTRIAVGDAVSITAKGSIKTSKGRSR